jgi:hypothetical protein
MIRRNAGLHYRSQMVGEDTGTDGEPGGRAGLKAHIDPHAATWRRKNRFRNWWRGRPALGR